MDSNQILAKEKLSFSGSFREALKILPRHPKFISFIIFVSFPLFSSWLTREILLQPTFIEVLKILSRADVSELFGRQIIEILCETNSQGVTNCFQQPLGLSTIEKLKATISQRFLILALLSSATIYILDLIVTITTVYISAIIYGGNNQMGLKEMLFEPVRKVGLFRPLVTSLVATLLASLTLLGLISLSKDIFVMSKSFIATLIIGPLFLVLLTKYIEWTSVWNMGIVISILDKNSGYIAIGVSAYLSRGSRKLGFNLMLAFFVLRLALRFPCLYIGWNRGSCGIWGNVVYVCLSCVGNVAMWVVLMVYFYDCKRWSLEKKIDVEDGKAAEAVQQ